MLASPPTWSLSFRFVASIWPPVKSPFDVAAGESPFDGGDLCVTADCYHGDVVSIRTFIMMLTEQ